MARGNAQLPLMKSFSTEVRSDIPKNNGGNVKLNLDEGMNVPKTTTKAMRDAAGFRRSKVGIPKQPVQAHQADPGGKQFGKHPQKPSGIQTKGAGRYVAEKVLLPIGTGTAALLGGASLLRATRQRAPVEVVPAPKPKKTSKGWEKFNEKCDSGNVVTKGAASRALVDYGKGVARRAAFGAPVGAAVGGATGAATADRGKRWKAAKEGALGGALVGGATGIVVPPNKATLHAPAVAGTIGGAIGGGIHGGVTGHYTYSKRGRAKQRAGIDRQIQRLKNDRRKFSETSKGWEKFNSNCKKDKIVTKCGDSCSPKRKKRN
jgi:hypothetical protein